MQFFLQVVSLNGVARQVAGRLQRVTYLPCKLSHNSFGLAAIVQSNLVLYGATFLACDLSRNGEKKKSFASCRRHSATCNLFKTNSMQSLQEVELSYTLFNCCKP